MATVKTEYTKEEILSALQVIKGVCETHRNCGNCPLRCDDDTCNVQDSPPCHWSIVPRDTDWRAFS